MLGSESESQEQPDGRQDFTEYDPLDDCYLSDDDGKKDIELCILKVTNEDGEVKDLIVS